MDKKIKQHEQYVNAEIAKIESGDSKEKAAKKLYDYHVVAVRDFQHERLIHLLVTFFFGGLFLASIAGLFVIMSLDLSYNQYSLVALMAGLVVILLVTEIFYVKYYYALENGIQKLYPLSKKLYDLL